MSIAIEEWLSRPQDQKCLRTTRPAVSTVGGSGGTGNSRGVGGKKGEDQTSSSIVSGATLLSHSAGTVSCIQEAQMVAWLRGLAKFGMSLEAYNDARHALNNPDAHNGSSNEAQGHRAPAALHSLDQPTLEQLPPFPRFPTSHHKK